MKKQRSPIPTVADIATFASLAAGVLALVFALQENMTLAGIFLLAAVLLDWLDGRIARKLKRQSPLGAQLDSLVDLCSFGLVPVALVFLRVGTSWPIVLSAILFVCAGAYRLARFMVRHSSKGFEGMPITANGIIFGGLALANIASQTFYIVVLLVSALLMVSTLKVRKL